jgi:hypothetical protein
LTAVTASPNCAQSFGGVCGTSLHPCARTPLEPRHPRWLPRRTVRSLARLAN